MRLMQLNRSEFSARLCGLLSVALMLWLLVQFADWAILNAVFKPSLQDCKNSQGVGACWGVIAEKWQVIFLGRYPTTELWRPLTLVAVWSLLLIITCLNLLPFRMLWVSWVLALLFGMLVMHGGVLGLVTVSTDLWAGLPLSLMIPVLCGVFAFPIAVLLAIGRSSNKRVVSLCCAVYIDFLRAIPLISVLFLAAFVLPLLLPGKSIDLFLRVVVVVSLFAAAYWAEVIRGGLQTLPKGQMASAKALGLTLPQAYCYVVLPQALRACLPSLVNSFVTLFKESSLVSIVGLFELMGGLSLALSGDVGWRQYYFEAYLVLAVIYWFYCSLISRLGARVQSA